MRLNRTCAVVLATYNGSKYIKEQLESLIFQTRKPDYILISDDNSNDNTIEICDSVLRNKGIKYEIIKNHKSLGVTKNFINASRMTYQDIIFFCDQDDIWKLSKIEKVMRVFEAHEDCKEVITDAYIWFKNKKRSNLLFQRLDYIPVSSSEGKIKLSSFWNTEIEKNIAVGMCMAITSDVIKYEVDNKIYNTNKLIMYHDSYYTLIAGATGNIYYVNEPLAFYRQHNNNVEGVAHHFSVSMINRSTQMVKLSFSKFQERIDVINKLENLNHFMDKANKNTFNKYIKYNNNRYKYITTNKTFEMIKLSFIHKQSVLFSFRDIFISIIYKK